MPLMVCHDVSGVVTIKALESKRDCVLTAKRKRTVFVRLTVGTDVSQLQLTSRIPVEGEIISVCDFYEIIYRIMILIIIIISLGQILLSYIANKSRKHTHMHARTHTCTRAHTHTRTHAHTHPPPSPFTLSLFDGSVRPTMTE